VTWTRTWIQTFPLLKNRFWKWPISTKIKEILSSRDSPSGLSYSTKKFWRFRKKIFVKKELIKENYRFFCCYCIFCETLDNIFLKLERSVDLLWKNVSTHFIFIIIGSVAGKRCLQLRASDNLHFCYDKDTPYEFFTTNAQHEQNKEAKCLKIDYLDNEYLCSKSQSYCPA